jgi:enoyl-CoA hydratase
MDDAETTLVKEESIMEYKNILLEIEDPIAVITINRPAKLNALNTLTFVELNDALLVTAKNNAVCGVLIKGAGEKAFVAGADINEIQALGLEGGVAFSRFGQAVFNFLEELSKPAIALIDGYALGGGLELALACHLRIATERSQLGQPEVSLGLIPGYGATQRLPRLIGRGPALEMLLTGDAITAARAYELGLVNKVVSPDLLMETGRKILLKIHSKSPLAVKHALHCVHRGLNMSLTEGLLLESDHFGMACDSEDMKEGAAAFLEKRPAKFRGK